MNTKQRWKHSALSALGRECWESSDGFTIVAGPYGYNLMVPYRMTPSGAYSTIEAVESVAEAKAIAGWPGPALGAALGRRTTLGA
ncbi:MAG TPA: hypothetical protein VFQ88_02995 [Nevskiaceae bacterium]|nr:hypothetical protein [Nevskiaceae bacterium]